MKKIAKTNIIAVSDAELDKEIADVLNAISVITRQLAKKITVKHMPKEETKHGKCNNVSFI